jgi:hypothetical protein
MLKAQDGTETKLPFYLGEADHKKERYYNGSTILGVTDGWPISTDDETQTAVWLLDKPVKAKVGDELVLNLGNAAVSSVRVSITPFAAAEPLDSGAGDKLHRALMVSSGRRSPAERELVNRSFLLATRWDTNAVAQDRKIELEIRECRNGRAFSMVAVSREPLVTRVLARGNWQDESGEIVQPATPHFLPQLLNADGRRLTRLDLAKWLVSPENPLTARALMNRLWKQFFGTGISSVIDDLGTQGEWPVQAELLDWLSCEFRDGPQGTGPAPGTKREAFASQSQAWDFKHMVKLIVMSSTYRQDSNQRPELKEVDPNNRLLACQSPRRLEAEFVRDNALYISGLLNDEVGGPSSYPYQPPGYYANLQFPDRDYHADQDERQYRRGVYTHWQRTFLQPMLANFDAPAREECIANRIISNTPQQALTLLNDPTFVEAARMFAARVLSNPAKSDVQKLDLAFERALARPARDTEKRSLLDFLATQRTHCQSDSAETDKLLKVGIAPVAKGIDHNELAAWTEVCRVILNLHETITRY